jgi:diguanylate cyclase (GGDEF)-like protein
MTGLLNRRQFYAITDQSNLNNLPAQQQFSLLLVDTDHFKNINDLFGHLKGDEVLIALSRTLEACSREGDMVFRWGGEEFVILLPRTLSTPRCRLPSHPCSRCPHYDSGLTAVYRQHWRGAA